jgi:hypothetical protein
MKVAEKFVKTPTAPTASSLQGMKDPLNSQFLRVRPRSVSPAAVDKAVSAHGSYEEYRPQESPAKRHITDGAGAAGGILLDVVIGGQALSCSWHPYRDHMDLLSPFIRLYSR